MAKEKNNKSREREIIEEKLILDNKNIFSSNNRDCLRGVVEDIEFSHEFYGEKFYSTKVEVKRISGLRDLLPIIVSESIEGFEQITRNKTVELWGEFRSRNTLGEDNKGHLDLYFFVKNINLLKFDILEDQNAIYLEGHICKPIIYRKTPSGREISEIFIAVNRKHRSDYIPAIAWERSARMAAELNVGERIQIYGKIQSREYFKRESEDSEKGERKIAYEISVEEIYSY